MNIVGAFMRVCKSNARETFKKRKKYEQFKQLEGILLASSFLPFNFVIIVECQLPFKSE